MAEARSAVAEPRVIDIEETEDAWKYSVKAWKRGLIRRIFTTWNSVRNGMWPTPIWNLGVTTSLFSVLLVGDWEWARPINSRLWYLGDLLHIHAGVPRLLRIPLIAGMGGLTFFIIVMYVRRWTLQCLLSYRGWMYEQPRTQSASTILWGAVVRLVSGYHPTTYSYQKSLPCLPVPPLKETMDNFLLSIKPLHGEDSETYQRYKREAECFSKGLGPKLQKILLLKSWWSQNWVTDWWEKYIYLMSRTPIVMNSNYYVLDHGYWQPTFRQISRAANHIYHFMQVKNELDHEKLTPLVIRNTIPLCMAQYESCFATTRIPGEDFDRVKTFKRSKHIAVVRHGLFYKLEVSDRLGNLLTPQNLERQLQWICDDADANKDVYNEYVRGVSALTGINRTQWARLRKKHFKGGVNKDTLNMVESALFHVVLETRSYKTWTERGKHLLHGDGSTFWFDKSFSMLVFDDGKMGFNCEHSWGDAPVMGHITEFSLTKEVLEDMYDSEGRCIVPENLRYTQGPLAEPQRFEWHIPNELHAPISEAVSEAKKNNDDLELFIDVHRAYGKGFIKTCKVSPDAFVQLALQMAYFKDSGKFALTYESSMTRLYLLGRTETVRSLTCESVEFVKAMHNGTSTEQCKVLLRKACDKHQKLYKDAMNGHGIDRHMFGLFVACKGLGYESEFLHDALMMPWVLSTSQQPQQQIANSPNCDDPKFRDKVCPGGGFGPVSDKGYGVSYMIPGDHHMFFHVSSKKAEKTTDSRQFMQLLFDSFAEMKGLFENTVASQTDEVADCLCNAFKEDVITNGNKKDN